MAVEGNVSIMGVRSTPMPPRTKRTYNLSIDAVAHVRDLAARDGLPASQDGIVELAIERLYRDVRATDDAQAWGRAADDDAFRLEMRGVAADLASAEIPLAE